MSSSDPHDPEQITEPTLTDGSVPQPWMAWLTTEHFNLQTERVATIGEATGRASVFLGTLSAGLIALGFAGAHHRSAATTTFQVAVLTAISILGTLTFVRCVQITIDDAEYGARIQAMRKIYAELLPTLAQRVGDFANPEQSEVMLRPLLARFQSLFTVAGTVCVVTALVAGGDVGVLLEGVGAPLALAIVVGIVVSIVLGLTGERFQNARWKGAGLSRRSAP